MEQTRGQKVLISSLLWVSFAIFIYAIVQRPDCGCGDTKVSVMQSIITGFVYLISLCWALYFLYWVLWTLTAIPQFIYDVLLGDKYHRTKYFNHKNWFGEYSLFSRISFVREFYGYSFNHFEEDNILSVNYDKLMKFCTLGLYRKKGIRLDKDTTLYKFMFFLSVISIIELISLLLESMLSAPIWIMFIFKVLICLCLLPIEKKLIKDKI